MRWRHKGSSARPRVPLRRRAAGSGWRPRRRRPTPSPAPRAVRRLWAAAVAGGGAGSAGGERTKGAESLQPRPGQVSPRRLGRGTRPIRAAKGTPGVGREPAGGQRGSAVPPFFVAGGGERGLPAPRCAEIGRGPQHPLPLARGPPGLSRKGHGLLLPFLPASHWLRLAGGRGQGGRGVTWAAPPRAAPPLSAAAAGSWNRLVGARWGRARGGRPLALRRGAVGGCARAERAVARVGAALLFALFSQGFLLSGRWRPYLSLQNYSSGMFLNLRVVTLCVGQELLTGAGSPCLGERRGPSSWRSCGLLEAACLCVGAGSCGGGSACALPVAERRRLAVPAGASVPPRERPVGRGDVGETRSRRWGCWNAPPAISYGFFFKNFV